MSLKSVYIYGINVNQLLNAVELVWINLSTHYHAFFSIDGLSSIFKDKDYCLMEIIKGLTDKGQFQYLTKLMGPQEGTYLYGTQFHSLR